MYAKQIQLRGYSRGAQNITFKAGEVEVIPADNRAIKPSWVRWLAANWDPNKVGVLVLNDREDGRCPFVVVGQHRVLGARDKYGPGYQFAAQLYVGLSRSEESEIWLGHDTQRRPAAPLDVYRMKTAAGRPEEIEINRILATHGMHIGQGNGTYAIGCPMAVASAYRRRTLDRLLAVCEAAWPSPSLLARALQVSLIQGLSTFIGRYPEYSHTTLVSHLAKNTPDNIIGMGRSRMGTGTSVGVGVCAAIVEIYNKGLRVGRLDVR